jgi:AcrR family transcriptional regulator
VEALAKQLGVTKGGFYGYFADREALLTAMLDAWERESTDEVLEQVEREGGDPRTKITRAGLLTFSSGRLLPIDLAIRDWARRELIGTFCHDPDEVEARSLLAFCLAIGEHFLAADHAGRTRGQVLARAADLVFAQPGTALAGQPGEQPGRVAGRQRAPVDPLSGVDRGDLRRHPGRGRPAVVAAVQHPHPAERLHQRRHLVGEGRAGHVEPDPPQLRLHTGRVRRPEQLGPELFGEG